MVNICVADTGKGMTQLEIDLVLDANMYYSGDAANTQRGSGLGLKLCKEFIQKSGGIIWIDSTPGQGTQVIFTLPVEKEEVVTEDSRTLIW